MPATSVIIGAAACGDIAAALLLLAAGDAGQAGVLDDTRLTGLCVLGSLIGAFLTVAVFPPADDSEKNKVRRLSAKFGASMAGGIAFTPMVIELTPLQMMPSVVLGVSAAVAMLIVSVLHATVPIAERAAAKWVGKRIDERGD